MATVKVVNGLTKDFAGAIKAGVTVVMEPSQACTIPGSQELLPSKMATVSAADGTWTLSVYSNADLTPALPYYKLREIAQDGSYLERTLVIPQTAGPFQASDPAINVPPLATPPVDGHVSTMRVDGASTIDGSLKLKGGPWIDPTHPSFGAKFDGKQVADALVTNGSPIVTSATAAFVAGDAGKIAMLGISGVYLSGTILSVQSATQATLSFNSTVTGTTALTWGTDDSAALQAWLNVVVPSAADAGQITANVGHWGLMPPGMAIVNAPLVRDQGLYGSFRISGSGWGGAGGGVTVLRAGPAMTNQDLFSFPNAVNAQFEDFDLDGFGTGKRGIVIIEGTPGPPPAAPSAESARNIRITNVNIRSFTDWHIYLDGPEDTNLIGVHVNPGGSLDKNALFINVPNGSAAAIGGGFFGICDLNYQTMSFTGCTLGPLRIRNPSSLQTLCLTLNATYHYDSTNHYCMESPDAFTDIVANGSFLIASVKESWVRGKLLGGVGLKFTGCGFLQSGGLSGQNFPVYCVTADGVGTGSVIFDSCSSSAFSSFANANRNTFRNLNGATASAITLAEFSNSFIAPDPFIASLLNTPATGVWTKNPRPVALELLVDRNGATVAAGWFAISPDGGTTVQDTGFPATATVVTKIIRPGQWYRFTYSAGQPKYGACLTA